MYENFFAQVTIIGIGNFNSVNFSAVFPSVLFVVIYVVENVSVLKYHEMPWWDSLYVGVRRTS